MLRSAHLETFDGTGLPQDSMAIAQSVDEGRARRAQETKGRISCSDGKKLLGCFNDFFLCLSLQGRPPDPDITWVKSLP